MLSPAQGTPERSSVLLTEPPRFDVFINLMADSDLILSDSGGIQEEVTQLRRYVLVLREGQRGYEQIGAPGHAERVSRQLSANSEQQVER